MSCRNLVRVTPPIAKQIPHTWQRPTGPADDPWAWLRDRDDPDTVAYLEAENAFADEWFDRRSALVETSLGEIKQRVQETDLSALVTKPAAAPVPANWKPYLDKLPTDPWGSPYVYEREGDVFALFSLGADGAEGGEGMNADIRYEDL